MLSYTHTHTLNAKAEHDGYCTQKPWSTHNPGPQEVRLTLGIGGDDVLASLTSCSPAKTN